MNRFILLLHKFIRQRSGPKIAYTLPIGIAVGTAVGVAIDKLTIGLAVGIAIAVIIGTIDYRKNCDD